MCTTDLKITLTIGFIIALQGITVALLLVCLILRIDPDNIQSQLLDPEILSIGTAALTCCINIFPITILCTNTYEILNNFRESIIRDVLSSDSLE